MVIRYPITSEVRNALQRFPRIAEEIRSKLLGSGRSELEIVRLLGNTHYKHIEALLAFVDNNLPASAVSVNAFWNRPIYCTSIERCRNSICLRIFRMPQE